jgi:hypothetical protein
MSWTALPESAGAGLRGTDERAGRNRRVGLGHDGSAGERESENNEELFHDPSLPAELSDARKSSLFVPRIEKYVIFVSKAEQRRLLRPRHTQIYFKSALWALPK